MASVATRDTWNFTIEDQDKAVLDFILSRDSGYRAGNTKKAVIQRALARLGMHAWMRDKGMSLAGVLPPSLDETAIMTPEEKAAMDREARAAQATHKDSPEARSAAGKKPKVRG